MTEQFEPTAAGDDDNDDAKSFFDTVVDVQTHRLIYNRCVYVMYVCICMCDCLFAAFVC